MEGGSASSVRASAGVCVLVATLATIEDSTREPRRRVGTWRVRLSQQYRGIPVEGGGYAVAVGPEGQVLFVKGRFFPGIELDTEPAFAAAEAESIATRDVGEGADPVKGPTALVVTSSGGDYRLAWSVTVPEDCGHVWVVHVDAHDGSVITRANLVDRDSR
jgi:Zn-dependent metalloprotease